MRGPRPCRATMFDGINITEPVPAQSTNPLGTPIFGRYSQVPDGLPRSSGQTHAHDVYSQVPDGLLSADGKTPAQDPRSETGCPRPQVPEVLISSPPVIDLTGPTPSRHEMPPEEQHLKGCSLMSMDPLRQWFCKGADVTSPIEYEAALQRLENGPPEHQGTV